MLSSHCLQAKLDRWEFLKCKKVLFMSVLTCFQQIAEKKERKRNIYPEMQQIAEVQFCRIWPEF